MHRIQVYTSYYLPQQSLDLEVYVIDGQSGNEEFCGVFSYYNDRYEQTITCVKHLIGNDVKFIKKRSATYHGFRLCEVRIYGQYI